MNLEIDGIEFDLDDDVFFKLFIEMSKVFDCGVGVIIFEVGFV